MPDRKLKGNVLRERDHGIAQLGVRDELRRQWFDVNAPSRTFATEGQRGARICSSGDLRRKINRPVCIVAYVCRIYKAPAAGVHQAVGLLDDLEASVDSLQGQQAIVVTMNTNIFWADDIVEHDTRNGDWSEANPDVGAERTTRSQVTRCGNFGNGLAQKLAQEVLDLYPWALARPLRLDVRAAAQEKCRRQRDQCQIQDQSGHQMLLEGSNRGRRQIYE